MLPQSKTPPPAATGGGDSKALGDGLRGFARLHSSTGSHRARKQFSTLLPLIDVLILLASLALLAAWGGAA